MGLLSAIILLATLTPKHLSYAARPHIVVVLADDLGWNEVSWHNPEVLTPHMEEAMRAGVELDASYVSPKCSPSRAALLTGRYPWRIGLQRGAIERFQPEGLDTSLKLLPEYLQDAGYNTHLVGKWHLGYCHPSYLPTRRGFQSAFGQWTHSTDYYTRSTNFPSVYNLKPEQLGYDFHNGENVTFEGEGEFLTDLLTKKAVEVISNHPAETPLFLYLAYQAPHSPITTPPQQYLQQYADRGLHQSPSNVDREKRERFGTISAVDQGVGSIVEALKAAGLYDNSVIVFSTDNGGPKTGLRGLTNLPLRGGKEQLYQGGVRGVGFVHSPLIKDTGKTSKQMMFITDWFSTLLGVAGLASFVPSDVDSMDMWPTLSGQTKKGPRREIVLNLDQNNLVGQWSAAVIVDNFKLIWGQSDLLKHKAPESACQVELFNLRTDPSEKNNLASKQKRKVGELKDRLMSLYSSMAPARYGKEDPAGWPGLFKGEDKGFFRTGWCELRETDRKPLL